MELNRGKGAQHWAIRHANFTENLIKDEINLRENENYMLRAIPIDLKKTFMIIDRFS